MVLLSYLTLNLIVGALALAFGYKFIISQYQRRVCSIIQSVVAQSQKVLRRSKRVFHMS